VLFSIPNAEESALDKADGLDKGYRKDRHPWRERLQDRDAAWLARISAQKRRWRVANNARA
jgi:hypothetical protein